ncbi:hypothetical protein [Candidatus Protochlamydia phocaeensis]|uniref:hypothetical protein n=1 Tax=Candidatus Protochlamydia phocaeensis TaxID=1414722 RepID=UPI000B01DEAC|nr:hypothetical protein [Candidatus Protochlamydia phocaeensis]
MVPKKEEIKDKSASESEPQAHEKQKSSLKTQRIQTAEGWKRAQLKRRQNQAGKTKS